MALEINIPTTKYGLVLPTAYVRVVPARLHEDGTMQVGLEVYVSKAARDAGAKPLPGIGFSETQPSGDIRTGLGGALVPQDKTKADPASQGYAGFKALGWNEFIAARDV